MSTESPNDTLSRLKQTIVFIKGIDGSGTGFLVSSDRIITANHVVKSWVEGDCYPVMVGSNRDYLKAFVIKRDENADAALLGLNESVDIIPFPIGSGLKRNMVWEGYGFPQIQNSEHIGYPTGLPLDGLVKDPSTKNDIGKLAILLYSDMAAAGNASPLNGFSGSPIIVAGALVGHLTKHIGDVDDKRRPRYGYIFACPIQSSMELFDFIPQEITIPPNAVASVTDSNTLEQFRISLHLGLLFESLEIPKGVKLDHLSRHFSFQIQDSPQNLIQSEDQANKIIYSYHHGPRYEKAKQQLELAELTGKQRSRTIISVINKLRNEVSSLNREVRDIEALSEPYHPVREKMDNYSGFSDEEYRRRESVSMENYQRDLAEYNRKKQFNQQSKEQLPHLKSRVFQLELQCSELNIDLNSFQLSLESQLSRLKREVEIVRGQEIVQHLSDMRDAARQSLHNGNTAPQGFSALLHCNAMAFSLKKWSDDSFQELDTVVKDVDAALVQAVKDFPIEIAMDCFVRCHLTLESLKFNRGKIEELNSIFDQEYKCDLEKAMTEMEKIKAIRLPGEPPKPNRFFRTNYDHVLDVIDKGYKKLGEVHEMAQSLINVNSVIYEMIDQKMKLTDELRRDIHAIKEKNTEMFNDLVVVWGHLCATKEATILSKPVFDLITNVKLEVKRRYSLSVDEIIEDCTKSGFLIDYFDALVVSSQSNYFRGEYQRMLQYSKHIDALTNSYLSAKNDALEKKRGLLSKFWSLFKKN